MTDVGNVIDDVTDVGKFADDFAQNLSNYKGGINAQNLKYSDSSQYVSRAYQNSTFTIQNIVDSTPPVADPRGSAGLYWKVEGSLNGSFGQYELLISSDKITIWHFLFKSYK